MEPVIAVYREFAAHAALQPYIRAVFSFVPGSGDDHLPRQQLGETLTFRRDFTCPPILADGHVCLSFNLGEVYHADGRWRVDPAGCSGRVVGPVTRADSSGVERRSMVGAYFHAAGLPAFASVAAHELTDGIATAEDIWGPAAAGMAGRLADVNEGARIDALETMLIARLGEQRRSHATVDLPGLAASIAQSGGRVAVEQLAFAAGVSRQHLTRLFRERVGVTPKLYARLARFQSGLACAGSSAAADRAQVALELGYADQSHWIAEFKEFSGLTPQQFAARRWLHPFVERALHGPARTRTARGRQGCFDRAVRGGSSFGVNQDRSRRMSAEWRCRIARARKEQSHMAKAKAAARAQARRGYEYGHEYGLKLTGKPARAAGPARATTQSRAKATKATSAKKR